MRDPLTQKNSEHVNFQTPPPKKKQTPPVMYTSSTPPPWEINQPKSIKKEKQLTEVMLALKRNHSSMYDVDIWS